MKTYIGTKLSPEDHRRFRIKAAEQGISKSALLKKLVLEMLAKAEAQKIDGGSEK